jgi:hypothetical protein
VQQLSPSSYVTQSTEITISSREAMKDTEQVAIMVHISASGTVHVHDEEPASRRLALSSFHPPSPPAKTYTKKQIY